ncbi:unnamed protein product [Prorocentrum cordatum]|uniref:Uncharacterized protein n=1 Tax=Prorocentrum cordatum TaxID=2364126 RepID=A0ABN9SKY9_9DINO|nr:unnamed protein product [Polarella glacialis]
MILQPRAAPALFHMGLQAREWCLRHARKAAAAACHPGGSQQKERGTSYSQKGRCPRCDTVGKWGARDKLEGYPSVVKDGLERYPHGSSGNFVCRCLHLEGSEAIALLAARTGCLKAASGSGPRWCFQIAPVGSSVPSTAARREIQRPCWRVQRPFIIFRRWTNLPSVNLPLMKRAWDQNRRTWTRKSDGRDALSRTENGQFLHRRVRVGLSTLEYYGRFAS